MTTTKTNPGLVYVIAHDGAWQFRLRGVGTTDQEPAVLMFTTQERAEAFCAKEQVPAPWPIRVGTVGDAVRTLQRAQNDGIRWLCVDPEENGWAVAEIDVFLRTLAGGKK